jgi:hypothetical protein
MRHPPFPFNDSDCPFHFPKYTFGDVGYGVSEPCDQRNAVEMGNGHHPVAGMDFIVRKAASLADKIGYAVFDNLLDLTE